MPLTPPELGSDQDSPYCSPQPMIHTESVYMPGATSLAAEKTHTTSGVSNLLNNYTATILMIYSADGHKIEPHSGLSANERRSTHTTSKSNSLP